MPRRATPNAPGQGDFLWTEVTGRNGFDPPHALQDNEAAEMKNVELYATMLAKKRGGAANVSTSGGTAFSGTISTLYRHVPTGDDTAAELWGIDDGGPHVKRLAGGTTWADVSLDDALGSRPQDVQMATLNGKNFVCYGVQTNAGTDTTAAATTGSNFTVSAGVTVITVKGWGAAGGSDGGDGTTAGGGGGFAQADIVVTPGEVLTKRVGGGGQKNANSFQGGSGGGYTGLFRGSTPLLIAAGGGGGAKDGAGGPGGDSTGSSGAGTGGSGGTQSAGGSPGGETGTPTISYLIVGGGGSGGNNGGGLGGGGGAGDVLVGSDALTLGASYSITIGPGGAASSGHGNNGTASTFNGHSAAGGGGGGSTASDNGSSGGSGGGGGDGPGASGGAGIGTNVASGGGGNANAGGGGGGATGAGGTAGVNAGGSGGPGLTSSISGSAVVYGGGGGGNGSASRGGGGAGGGGTGGAGGNPATAGTANTGGGGGAGDTGGGSSGAGGSGIVILSYVTGTILATGGTITTSGGNTIHTFTSNGTLIVATAGTAGGSLTGGAGGGWQSGGGAGSTGGTNGGGAGGAHGTAATFWSGGGGGSGYYGGGGGAASRVGTTTGGGGGGSSFVSGTNTKTVGGSGLNAGNNTDSAYAGNAGKGTTSGNGNDGLLVITWNTSVDRLHVYDPSLASPRIRRVGFPTASAPTVANTGSGSYANTLRYYRQRSLQLNGSIVVRRSEPSTSVSFTPSGSGTAARVTRGAFPGEGETHWEVEVSLDNVTFYRLSQVVIGTTTYDDSAVTTTYSSNPLSDPIGMYVAPLSWKYILATGARLLGAGAYTAGDKQNRVYWTPVLGSSDQGDDERVPQNLTSAQYTDLSENSGDVIVGLAGPIFNGVVFVFMKRSIWRLTPTGDVTAPYLSRQVSTTVGAMHQKLIVKGEDEVGQEAIYFASYFGIYRIATNGLQYLGHDLEDLWYGLDEMGRSTLTAVNLTPANSAGWAEWHGIKKQVWFHLPTGTSADANARFRFHVKYGATTKQNEVRFGWTVDDGASTQVRCGCMFSNTLGIVMSRDLKPYVGYTGSTTLLKCDTTDTDDNGTPFQAFVTSKPFMRPAGIDDDFGFERGYLQAVSDTNVSIQQTLVRNFGRETQTSTFSLSPASTESRVLTIADSSKIANASTLQVTLGDAAAVSNVWNLDAWSIVFERQGDATI